MSQEEAYYYGDDEEIPPYRPPYREDGFARTLPFQCVLPSNTRNVIRKQIEELVNESQGFTNVKDHYTEIFLRHYKWNDKTMVTDFTNIPPKIFGNKCIPSFSVEAMSDADIESAGPPPLEEGSFSCPITAELVANSKTLALGCGHRYSYDGWRGYLRSRLSDAQLALNTRCPEIDCDLLVASSVWKKFLSAEDQERLDDMRYNAFVDGSTEAAWCPAKGCGRVVLRLRKDAGDYPKCDCGHGFCFPCGEEPHRPVSCDIVKRWREKNASDGECMNWVLVNTKPCPGCHQAIEKASGCMHMTCRCKHEFCWVCLEKWATHSGGGGPYNCNLYRNENPDETMSEDKKRAKQSLDRYAHYYERFRAHSHSQKLAKAQLQKVTNALAQMHQSFSDNVGSVDFLKDAVSQVIECRCILKFSYAFGYFADWEGNQAAQNLFEYHQGQLEQQVDSLQETTEKFDADKYVGGSSDQSQQFEALRNDLVNKTKVVKDFFEKMSTAFEVDFFQK